MNKKISYRGSKSDIEEVFWNEELKLFYCFKNFPHRKKFWNSFRKENSRPVPKMEVDVQINFHYEGVIRFGGVLGKDENNKIFVLHTGKIGGGLWGIGKELFKNNSTHKWLDVILNDSNKTRELALIGCINNPDFLQKLNKFVSEVHEMKSQFRK